MISTVRAVAAKGDLQGRRVFRTAWQCADVIEEPCRRVLFGLVIEAQSCAGAVAASANIVTDNARSRLGLCLDKLEGNRGSGGSGLGSGP